VREVLLQTDARSLTAPRDVQANNEIADIPDIKERYRAIRARISQRTHRDKTVCDRLLNKYGKRERDRTVQRVHLVSKKIVKHAIENQLAINLEKKLKGIRRPYRRGDGQGNSYRGRMNSWVFHEDQRQIDYNKRLRGLACP
jgi:putative transposase